MLVAKNVLGARVLAQDAPFGSSGWLCPECSGGLVLKKGDHVIHHYAHKNIGDCSSGGETIEHMKIKFAIFQAAQNRPGIEAMLEHPIGGHRRADVAIHGKIRKVAIEVQLSTISPEEIWARMKDHLNAGYSTMWVVKLDCTREMNQRKHKYPVRQFQREIHDFSGESLFVHRQGLDFDVVHLMGHNVRLKLHYFLHRPLSIFDTVDDKWSDCNVVVPPAHMRWWEKPEPEPKPKSVPTLSESIIKSYPQPIILPLPQIDPAAIREMQHKPEPMIKLKNLPGEVFGPPAPSWETLLKIMQTPGWYESCNVPKYPINFKRSLS